MAAEEAATEVVEAEAETSSPFCDVDDLPAWFLVPLVGAAAIWVGTPWLLLAILLI
jgi:hypothetical protein